MKFSEFKKTQTKEELEIEIKALENSLKDLPSHESKVLENKINRLKEKVAIIDSTMSADIAQTQANLFANCTQKEDCECGKCQMLKREDIQEKMVESSPFGGFFSK